MVKSVDSGRSFLGAVGKVIDFPFAAIRTVVRKASETFVPDPLLSLAQSIWSHRNVWTKRAVKLGGAGWLIEPHVKPYFKDAVGMLPAGTIEAVSKYVLPILHKAAAFAQPHVDAAFLAAKPSMEAARAFIQPAIAKGQPILNAALAHAQPFMDAAAESAQPAIAAITSTFSPAVLAAVAAGTFLVVTRLGKERTGSLLPEDPKGPLFALSEKINAFKRRQRKDLRADPLPPSFLTAQTAPFAKNKVDPRMETDKQLATLAHNASVFSTICFIHSNRLKLQVDDLSYAEILRKSSLPGTDLWKIYMEKLGGGLTFWQKARARAWFFFIYTLGIVPNSIHTFLANMLREAREKLVNPNSKTFNSGLEKLLNQSITFLDIYNNATAAYAEAKNPKGDLAFYLHEAVERVGGKSMPGLCKEFCNTLVNEFFPRIPFFENLKKVRFIGWIFYGLDALIGWPINFIGRMIVKWQIPSVVESIVTSGVDATSAQNLQFTVAITKTLTEQFNAILGDMDHSEDFDDISDVSMVPVVNSQKLTTVIEKLLKTVTLQAFREEEFDSQEKMKKKIRSFDRSSWKTRTIRKAIRDGAVIGGAKVLQHFAKNMEPILTKVLTLSNLPFQPGTAAYTKKDYDKAHKELRNSAKNLFQGIIIKAIRGPSAKENKELILAAHRDQQDKARICLAELQRCLGAAISQRRGQNAEIDARALLIALDRYTDILKQFEKSTPLFKVDQLDDRARAAFYEEFYPLYQEIPTLMDLVLKLQMLQTSTDNHSTAVTRLPEIDEAMMHLTQHLGKPPSSLAPDLLALRRIGEKIKQDLPPGAKLVSDFERILHDLEMEIHQRYIDQATFAGLSTLGSRSAIARSLAANPGSTTQNMLQAMPKGKNSDGLIASLHRLDAAVQMNVADLSSLTNRVLNEYDIRMAELNQIVSSPPKALEELRAFRKKIGTELGSNNRSSQNKIASAFQTLYAKTNQVARKVNDLKKSAPDVPLLPKWLAGLASYVVMSDIMEIFENAYRFIITKDIYEAGTRMTMRTVIDSYHQ